MKDFTNVKKEMAASLKLVLFVVEIQSLLLAPVLLLSLLSLQPKVYLELASLS